MMKTFFSIFSCSNISNEHKRTTKQFVDANTSRFPIPIRPHYWSNLVDVDSWPVIVGHLLICCKPDDVTSFAFVCKKEITAKYHFTWLLFLLYWVLLWTLVVAADIQVVVSTYAAYVPTISLHATFALSS